MSDMKNNFHIEILKKASTHSASLKFTEFMNMHLVWCSKRQQNTSEKKVSLSKDRDPVTQDNPNTVL